MAKVEITAAYGSVRFLQQALTLACSIIRSDGTRGLSLVTDARLAAQAETHQQQGFFEHIFVLEPELLMGFKGKSACATVSPYDRTIFIDSDCLLVQKVEYFWQNMDTKDFCIQGEVKTGGLYRGINISSWMRELELPYFPSFNGGCFSWNRRGKAVLERALEILSSPTQYNLPLSVVNDWYDDQPAIGIAMAEQQILPLPNALDLHYTFEGATSPLSLDLEKNICRFRKGTYWTEPCVFHYNPLDSLGMYRSASRRVLEQEVSKLRASFGLNDFKWPKPDLRTLLWMIIHGEWRLKDPR